MKNKFQNEFHGVPLRTLCLAMATVFSTAAIAEEDDIVTRLIKPESSFSFGVGNVSTDRGRFGTYNGLDRDGAIVMGEFSLINRNDETGTWTRASGRNLGLDATRQLNAEYERQGSWRTAIDFGQTTRVTPYNVLTGLTGIGSAQQVVPSAPTPGTSNTLSLERQKTVFEASAIFLTNFEFKLKLQNEEKDGSRLFGRGTTGGTGGHEFLAEPINSTTRQIDAVLDYTGEKLQLSGGYYGSFYENHNPALEVSGGRPGFANFNNIALPPDNSAHQFHLAGGYQFAKTTRGSFKIAKTKAIQDDSFINVLPLSNNSGRTDLGGQVDTTLVFLGLTSRPITNLSLLANLRYEDRDDKTSVAQYLTSGVTGTASTDGFNEPRSLTVKSGKLEGTYRLPAGFRLTGGVDVEQKERSMAGVRIVGYRQKTDETTYRVEVKRTMAETMSGSLALLHSKRDGSDYRSLVTANGTTPYPNYSGLSADRGGLIQPVYMADRERDKVRLAMDWSPLEPLSLQFMVEGSRDNYADGRGTPNVGARKGDAQLYSIDAAYKVNDQWKLNGWLTRTESGMEQATIANAGNDSQALLWSANQKNTVDSYGLGVRGKLLSGRVDVGGDYVFAYDKTKYNQGRENYTPFTSATTVSNLPDITNRLSSLRLFSSFAYDKATSFRLDYMTDKRRTDDWTWSDWTYTDGTQVILRPDQRSHFVGLSVRYAFR
jgi:MtrB/PioB family decaheme-associated outer membrane protein